MISICTILALFFHSFSYTSPYHSLKAHSLPEKGRTQLTKYISRRLVPCREKGHNLTEGLSLESMYSWKWHENGTISQKIDRKWHEPPKGTFLYQNHLWWCKIVSMSQDVTLQQIWDISAKCHTCDVTSVTKYDIFRTWSDRFNMGRVCLALMSEVTLQSFKTIGRREAC